MPFVWVRGGEWAVKGTSAVPRSHPESMKAVLRRISSGGDDVHPDGPHRVATAPTWPPASPAQWNQEWGNTVGLIAYLVDEATAKSALSDARAFADLYSDIPASDVWVSDESGEEALAAPIADRLLHYLRTFGPLGFVKPLGNVPSVGEQESEGAVDLLLMAEDLDLVGRASHRASARLPREAEHQRSDELVSLSRDYLRQVSLEPYTRDGELHIAARPASLLAQLWLSVIDQAMTTRSVCWECDTLVERRTGRGRPFAYCEEHRTEAAKKRRYRRGPTNPYSSG